MSDFNGENPPRAGLSEPDARLIVSELATTRSALLRIIRELEQLRHNTERNEKLTSATRLELAELRATLRNAEANAKGQPSPIAQIIRTIQYRPPVPRTQVLEKESRDREGPRIFTNGHEVIGGKVAHVTRAKTSTGALVELPCNYDLAHRFLSMPTPNRRKHWRGHNKTYTAMLSLSERAGFVSRVGRAYAWAERYSLVERMNWLSQFRPPLRTR